ncbi:MAG: hypothetical protein ACPGJI_06880 [Kangiellaceae bacterium]
MNKKPSITDWIQSLAVFFGVMFAIYEFVLHDRTLEREKVLYTMKLLEKGQSSRIEKAVSDFTVDVKYGFDYVLKAKKEGRNIEEVDSKKEFSEMMSPLLYYFESWSLCYTNDLCIKEISKEYACGSVPAIIESIDDAISLHDGAYVSASSHFLKFNEICKRYIAEE